MNLTMDQTELEEAVRAHIAKTGLNCDISSITFTATRGDAGIVTEVKLTAKASSTGPIPRTLKSVPEAPRLAVEEAGVEVTEAVAVAAPDTEIDALDEEIAVKDAIAAADSPEPAPKVSGKSLFR